MRPSRRIHHRTPLRLGPIRSRAERDDCHEITSGGCFQVVLWMSWPTPRAGRTLVLLSSLNQAWTLHGDRSRSRSSTFTQRSILQRRAPRTSELPHKTKARARPGGMGGRFPPHAARTGSCVPGLTLWMESSAQVPNSGRRDASWDCNRWMIDECIWETRDSLKSSVAPISFIVNSS